MGNTLDLLVTDLNMLEMSGEDLIHALQAEQPDLPIVVITGSAPFGGLEELRRQGGGHAPFALLHKPLDYPALLDTLRCAVTGKRLSPGLSHEAAELATDCLHRSGSAPNWEALEMLRQAPDRIDLLFTDLSMPGGMTGLMLAERARTLHPRLRVLLATGYSDDLVGRAAPMPGVDVLGKPYSQTNLAKRVRAILNNRDGHGDRGPALEGRPPPECPTASGDDGRLGL